MRRYVFLKLLSLAPVLLGISLVAFLLGVISPGDPAEIALSQGGFSSPTARQIQAMREELGLNEPLPVQYGRWLRNALRGDLGVSYISKRPVLDELIRRLPTTLALAGHAVVIACLFGFSLGLLAAAHKDTRLDQLIKGLISIMLSFPAFWLALLMILFFAETLSLLPTSGVGGFSHMIMPALVLSSAVTGSLARLVRASVSGELGRQYLLAADGRGLSKARLILTHALPNAIPPAITMLGNYLGGILGGSVVVETLFALPGVGSYAIDAIYARDYPVLQGYVLLTGLVFVIITLGIDLLCAALNPKIRLGGGVA